MGRTALHTVEALTKIIDSQCGNASWTLAAARGGVSVPTLSRWRDLSANGNSEFILEWNGISAQFTSHLARARLVFMAQIEAAALNRAHRGTREKIFHGGKPSWRMDHRYEGWSDDDLSALGLTNEDRYEHDELTGARVQHEIMHAPPVELVKTVLSAYAKRYQPQSHVNVDQHVALGVTVIDGKNPKAVDVTPRAPMIEHVGKPTETPGVFEEITEQPVEQENFAAGAEVEIEQPVNGNPAVNHDPQNPMRRALLIEQEIRDRRIAAERAAGKLPPQAPVVPPELRPDPDRDLADDGSAPVKAAPPTMDTVAEKVHAIKKKVRDGIKLSAIEQQVKNALARGSIEDARKLLGFTPTNDHEGIGRGDAPAGGAEITGGGTKGSQRMVS